MAEPNTPLALDATVALHSDVQEAFFRGDNGWTREMTGLAQAMGRDTQRRAWLCQRASRLYWRRHMVLASVVSAANAVSAILLSNHAASDAAAAALAVSCINYALTVVSFVAAMAAFKAKSDEFARRAQNFGALNMGVRTVLLRPMHMRSDAGVFMAEALAEFNRVDSKTPPIPEAVAAAYGAKDREESPLSAYDRAALVMFGGEAAKARSSPSLPSSREPSLGRGVGMSPSGNTERSATRASP